MPFVKVCPLAEIPADGAMAVEIDDTPVALVRSGEDVFALNDPYGNISVPGGGCEFVDHGGVEQRMIAGRHQQWP